MIRRAFDEAEHLRTAKPAPLTDGLWAIQFAAPSVPSPTSENAADRVMHTAKGRSKRAADLKWLLELICETEAGRTSDELDALTGLGSGTICPRIGELRVAGYIDTSETITRPTRRHSPASVHFATTKGRRRLAESEAA